MLDVDLPEAHKELIRAGWSPPTAMRIPALVQWLIRDQTLVDKAGCWVWQRTLRKGYGYLWGKGTHRLAYETWIGPIGKGLHLDHLCRNRACCRPDHLEPVTPAENNRRALSYVQQYPGEQVHHGAKRWCKRGHPFDEANTRFDRVGVPPRVQWRL